MFDRLIDFLENWLELLYFVHVVNCYEAGVQLRFGKFKRILEPGWRWYWPLKIDQVMVCQVVADTEVLSEQSLTTADGHSVTLRGVLTFEIEDVRKYFLDVQDRKHALEDSACGAIGARVLRSKWEEIITPDFTNAVTIEVRRNAKKYGIKILEAKFQDMTKCGSLRLWNTSTSTQTLP